jgi:thiol-disulfide isomerase/thioredoxin
LLQYKKNPRFDPLKKRKQKPEKLKIRLLKVCSLFYEIVRILSFVNYPIFVLKANKVIMKRYISLAILSSIGFTSLAQDKTIAPNEVMTQITKKVLKNENLENTQDYVFTNLDGTKFGISKFKGKVILIDFWETWCKPCVMNMPTLDMLGKQYKDKLVVIAANTGQTDTDERLKAFKNKTGYEFVWAWGDQMAYKLSIASIPFKVYLDPEGNYITHTIGYGGSEKEEEKLKEILDQYFD